MTNDEFDSMVAKLEHQARQNPESYRFKVLLLAMLGNAYLFVMLLLLIALFIASLASIAILKALGVKLVIVIGVFLWMIIKALWVKIAPPVGTEVKPHQAPELFAMIQELRRALRSPPFHHVLITDDFNAGVVQSPRLGIFGWPRNYLLIGLPLLKTLSVDQFKAVLAHEFGHLAKGHGRMSNWIYRQRLRWSRLLTMLEAMESRGSFLFKPFINWYSPYFNAYSFPLARANEYEADAASARLTSAATAAQALTSTHVVGRYLTERYWPQIYKQADDQPQPAFLPYHGIGQYLVTDVNPESAQLWLEQSLAEKTTSSNTHPSLYDRLQAIAQSAQIALPSGDKTADRLLGNTLQSITDQFDENWKARVLPSWQQHFQEISKSRKQLADLNARFQAGTELSLQEAYTRARLTESVGNNPDNAFQQFQSMCQRAPAEPMALFSYGTRLLARNDVSGQPLLEQAMQADEMLIVHSCEAIRDYYWRNDKKEEARSWHERMAKRSQLEAAAAEERKQLHVTDKFEVHGLPEANIADLVNQLKAIPELRKVYFVRKRLTYLSHIPLYALGFTSTRALQIHNTKRAANTLEQIKTKIRFPGETIIFDVEGKNYRFGRKFKIMRGSRIL